MDFLASLSQLVSLFSRARESAADRTAATVIGSPALASALRTLDERIADTSGQDLRDVSNLSSLFSNDSKPSRIV